jgi:hypothetical protein
MLLFDSWTTKEREKIIDLISCFFELGDGLYEYYWNILVYDNVYEGSYKSLSFSTDFHMHSRDELLVGVKSCIELPLDQVPLHINSTDSGLYLARLIFEYRLKVGK